MSEPSIDLAAFSCPRCTQMTSAAFWGPCEACRAQLRARMGTDAREVIAEAYEPKMNVTPNSVATKD